MHRSKNGTRTSSLPKLSKTIDWELKKVAELDKHLLRDEETYSRHRSRDCGHLQDSRRSLVPTHRPVRREECARRDRHCQSTPRVEATHPDCGISPLAERDQEVGQRVCSTISKRTDAQRHRQSGVHESGPREIYRRAMETQVDVDKVEPHNLEDKVLAFIRNNTSGTAPMNIGNIAPGQTPAPGLGSSSQSTSSSSHRGSDSYPDLNNHEHASQWGQDWNAGDTYTSGSSDGELYGLQKGKRERQKWKFQRHLLQLWRVISLGQVLVWKRWKSKRKGKEGRLQRFSDSKGWTAGKGWSEGKGWNTSSKGWEQQRPSGMDNLERDSKQYDVLVMETST